MSDLPTRESVELATETYVSDWTELDGNRVCAIVDAYTDGKLMTEAEWIQTLSDRFSVGTVDNRINYEAAARARKLWRDANDKSAVTMEEVMDEKMSIEAALPEDGILVSPSNEWKRWCTDTENRLLHVAELDSPDEPEHQHQFLPWLSLPNGSSWTGCASCDWQYQYDYPYR